MNSFYERGELENMGFKLIGKEGEIGLEIYRSLRFVKNIKLFGATSNQADFGKTVYRNYITNVPFISEPDFDELFNKILSINKIDYIFPAYDDVILKLASMEKDGTLCAKLLAPNYEVCEICRSKSKTYAMFQKYGITPKIYTELDDKIRFPVFIKPDIGQGSQNAQRINDIDSLIYHTRQSNNMIVLELLPGREYTVDCFTDRKRNLLYCGMRERIRIKNGISVHSRTTKLSDEVRRLAQTINSELHLRGVWFFQIKEDDNGRLKLLEIAPRIAGAMCLHRNKGINFALLSIYDQMGFPVRVFDNLIEIEVERALTNKFIFHYEYNAVYLDFDDTFMIDRKVNTMLLAFLYQCLNNGIELHLITKHLEDIFETLKKIKVDKNIFKSISRLMPEQEKCRLIDTNKKAIFIDDSFAEREAVSKRIGIPCFDLDAMESLLDDRC